VTVTAGRLATHVRASARRDAPWTIPQLRLAVIGGVLGLVLLVVSYLGAAGSADVDTQLGWLALAIVGLLVFASGGGALLLFGHRAVLARWARLARTRGRRRAHLTSRQIDADASGLIWVPGTHRVHRAECQLVAGKAVEYLAETDADAHGLTRCEVCAP
jgi:hypothetical protein